MITQTCDMGFVNSIISDPEIWEFVAPEDVPVFFLPYDNRFVYFNANHGEGVIIFHPFLDGMKIHPNFPKEHRGKGANEAIQESIQEMFSRGIRCIYCEIDTELTHVIRLARQLGFQRCASPFWPTDRGLLVRYRLDA